LRAGKEALKKPQAPVPSNPIGGPGGFADDLRKQLTGCLFLVATAESESRAVCQLVELRMSRFLTDRVCHDVQISGSTLHEAASDD
jgi:hypothetical protein